MNSILNDEIKNKSIKKHKKQYESTWINLSDTWPKLWDHDKLIENKSKQLWNLFPNQFNVKWWNKKKSIKKTKE